MKPRARDGFLTACALLAALAACGKRGDPLPPLRRAPQPVTALKVAQRGDTLEVSYTTPRAATDGTRLGVLDVELLRAGADGDFARVATRASRKAAPGETLVEVEPLPSVGSTLRFAARALAKGHPSVLSGVVSLTVQPPPEPPTALSARSSAKGVSLAWTPPAHMPEPPPSPAPPSATPSPEAGPVPPPPSPEPSAQPTGGGAEAGPVPAPTAVPVPTPTSSPTPRPATTGFWVYRRARDGAYGRALAPAPVETPAFDDASAAPGESWCYVVRTVASTDPVVESAPTEEACLSVEDVTPPSPPIGVAALVRQGAAEVSWTPSPEPDLALYRVHRAMQGARAERLAEVPAGTTAFRDTGLGPGAIYLYTVTAVDKAGNESAPSSPAPASLP